MNRKIQIEIGGWYKMEIEYGVKNQPTIGVICAERAGELMDTRVVCNIAEVSLAFNNRVVEAETHQGIYSASRPEGKLGPFGTGQLSCSHTSQICPHSHWTLAMEVRLLSPG